MEEAYAVKRPVSHIALPWGRFAKGAATILFITFWVTFAIYQQSPPPPKAADIALAEFSSGRAMQHVSAIAMEFRPVGSAHHDQVRDYIVKQLTDLGLEPQIQRSNIINQESGGEFFGGSIENIVARLKGTDAGKALMLVGHYDSVPTGPGASDDASSVAAMLETLRALKSGPALENDLIFLFTDGEELGLLGAKAFVQEHPWASGVGLAINLEARGNSGPSIMFETSADNGWLIREFAKAAPYPVANSLSYEIYKRLPNDTDMNVFKRAGMPGMNFAYIDGLNHYHAALDNMDNLNEASLQHQGSYALSLARHFGNVELGSRKEANAIYFNVPGSMLIHYPQSRAVPLAATVAVLFIAVIVFGFKKDSLTTRGLSFGTAIFLSVLVVAPLVVIFIWWVLLSTQSGYSLMPRGDVYNSHLFLWGFVFLTVAIVSSVYTWSRKKTRLGNLMAGALLWWVILMILASLYFPGASYLFTWPLLFAILALAFFFARGERAGGKSLVVFSVCAIPGIVMFTQIIQLTFPAVALNSSEELMALVVLVLGLLIPHISAIADQKKWLVPASSMLLSILFVVAAVITFHFDDKHPKPGYLFYGFDADNNKATWASAFQKPDEWNAQFFSQPERGRLPEYFPFGSFPFLKNAAPTAELPAPNVQLISDEKKDGLRTLRLQVLSPRRAPIISVFVTSDTEVIAGEINGRRLAQKSETAQAGEGNRWTLRYNGVPEDGLGLVLQTRSTQAVSLRVVDQSYGLPETLMTRYKPKPDNVMPAPLINNNTTLVSKSFTF